MSIVPAFDFGLWNAWIFIIPLLIFWIFGIKFLFSKRMPENTPPEKKRDKILTKILVLVMFGSFFYSIFLPLKLGTIWLSIGILVYIIGIILIIISMINFATTPLEEPVTKGIYRFSRNPMFIGFFLVYAGIAFASMSWVYFVITITFILIVYYTSPFEEEMTLKKYGATYNSYMKRTPKWIGIPKKR
jgi:protein-S-isoprenylcysteine O-methyltransferase Ste14